MKKLYIAQYSHKTNQVTIKERNVIFEDELCWVIEIKMEEHEKRELVRKTSNFYHPSKKEAVTSAIKQCERIIDWNKKQIERNIQEATQYKQELKKYE